MVVKGKEDYICNPINIVAIGKLTSDFLFVMLMRCAQNSQRSIALGQIRTDDDGGLCFIILTAKPFWMTFSPHNNDTQDSGASLSDLACAYLYLNPTTKMLSH